jgi:Ca-activated chloride channel homolog
MSLLGSLFRDPWWLLLLVALPVVAWARHRGGITAVVVPAAYRWHVPNSAVSSLWPAACAYVGIAMLIIALARPQAQVPEENAIRRGYDLVICIDLSNSMFSEDFKRGDAMVNRLQAVRPVISAFINNRPNDRIGVVVFAGKAYTFAPLTFDHEWLRKQTARLYIGMVEDGTAIGDALAIAIARLKEGWKDKTEGRTRAGSFIILLTDGANNKGTIEPRAAAALAAEAGIQIYAVGAGTTGRVPAPVFDAQGHRTGTELQYTEIDPGLLKDVADKTGGASYMATETNAVRDAFYAIDSAQTADFGAAPPMVTRELFGAFAWLGVILLGLAACGVNFRRARDNSKPLSPAIRRVSIGSSGSVSAANPRKSDPAYLIIAAVALGIVALARPRWGEQTEQSFSQSIEVMIALDLSRSMWTHDMPNQTARLSVAKATVARLLDGLRGETVGLVVFAGTSFVQVPMSPDYQIVREFLPSLDPNYMPVGGTDYDRMLGAALEGFTQANDHDRYLIVLSDGENTKPGPEPRIPALLRRSIHVIGIGFGTEQGGTVPDRPVISRLTPATLQDLATRTEGQYVAATTLPNATAVRKLIQGTVESGRAGRVRHTNTAVGIERFQWFLAPAVLLSLLSLAREFQRHPRPRLVHPSATTAVGAALTILICVLATPRAQAQHNWEGDPAQRVRAISSHMGQSGYDPYDLKLLVQAQIQFAIDERAHGRLPLRGVMHDAVDAVHMGKKLDPRMAQWDHYESQIQDLLTPLPIEAQAKDPQNNDKDDDDDEQNYRPVPLRKAKDKEGKDLFAKNTKSRSEFALGDLSGDETFAPQEPHGSHRRPPKPRQNPALTPWTTPVNDPMMLDARKNFAIVVKADSPGRVHQLLNGEAKRGVEQDW